MGRDIGHIEVVQSVDCCGAVVVGGSADERETGQRDEGVDIAFQISVDGGSAVESAGKGRDTGDAFRLERANDGIIVCSIRRQNVGAHHQ